LSADASAMTCYFRHLQNVFEEAGIKVTKENKKQIDRAIHKIVNTKYKNCPLPWRRVKERIQKDEVEKKTFINELKMLKLS
jgi:molecular chaperone GrpE (heat shock protein)